MNTNKNVCVFHPGFIHIGLQSNNRKEFLPPAHSLKTNNPDFLYRMIGPERDRPLAEKTFLNFPVRPIQKRGVSTLKRIIRQCPEYLYPLFPVRGGQQNERASKTDSSRT